MRWTGKAALALAAIGGVALVSACDQGTSAADTAPGASGAARIDPENVVMTEPVPGSDIPVHLMYVETWDGLYTPIGLRKPDGPGPHPVVLLASGNGGGGMAWVRDAVRNQGYIMERLLEAGYAVVWMRYRAEVELGYNEGGPYVEDMRQGRQLLSRSPLEYEDAIAIAEHVGALGYIDESRVGYLGLSHGGEMALKITSEYHGLAAAVANEPASHEFFDLRPDETASVNEETGLRNLEQMQMDTPEKVRPRINYDLVMERMSTIRTPILVMGRDHDHLQGIFRLTYDLLDEAGKTTEWVSFDHPEHGYVYPDRGEDGGAYDVDAVQDDAIDAVVDFFERHM